MNPGIAALGDGCAQPESRNAGGGEQHRRRPADQRNGTADQGGEGARGHEGGERSVAEADDQASERGHGRRHGHSGGQRRHGPGQPGGSQVGRWQGTQDGSEREPRCDRQQPEHRAAGARHQTSLHGHSLGRCAAARNGTNAPGRVAGASAAPPILGRIVNSHPVAVMSRAAFLAATDELIATGEGIVAEPDWDRFRAWLIESDALLERVWGRMDRYHLAWLNVGRDSAPPGSALDDAGTNRFIGEVAGGKLAVLRTMRDAVERRGSALLSDDDDADEDEDDE